MPKDRIIIKTPVSESEMFGGRMPSIIIEGRSTTGRLREEEIDKPANINKLKSYKKGGKVKKTGVYKLHRGETVKPAKPTTAARRRKMRRAMIGDK